MNRLDYERWVEIQEEMIKLLDEAKTLVRQSGNKGSYERAKATWIAQIDMGLSKKHYNMPIAGVLSMDNTLMDLEPDDEEYPCGNCGECEDCEDPVIPV